MRQTRIIISTLICTSLLSSCATTKPQPIESNKAGMNQEASIANVQMGMTYLKANNTVAAKGKFLKALQQSPKLPSSWYAMAYYHEVTGDTKLADEEYRKSIQVAPESGEAHNNYGTFLCRTGRYKEAISQFKLAIDEPNYMQDGAAYENAGICAMQIPDDREAYQLFQKALLNNPNLTNALLHFGQLSYKLKDYITAKNSLDRYLQIHEPNDDSSKLAYQLSQVKNTPKAPSKNNALINQRFKMIKAKA